MPSARSCERFSLANVHTPPALISSSFGSMYRRDLSRSARGRSRVSLSSLSAFLRAFSLDDERRIAQAAYKASIQGKRKRRDAKAARKGRDTASGEQGTYETNQGLGGADDENSGADADAAETVPARPEGTRSGKQRQRAPQRCSACGQVGHRRDRCPNTAPERAGGEAGPSSEAVESDPESDPESDEDAAEDPSERPDDAACAYCGVCNVFVVPCGYCDAWVHRECAFAAFPELYPDEAFYDMSVDVQCEVCSTVPEAE